MIRLSHKSTYPLRRVARSGRRATHVTALLLSMTMLIQSATTATAQQAGMTDWTSPGLRPLGETSLSLETTPTLMRLPTVESPPTHRLVAWEEQTHDDSMLERLEELEAKWAQMEMAEAAAKKQAATEPNFVIGGRIHFDSTMFPNTTEGINNFENPGTGIDPEDRVFFRRIRLEAKGDILENMLVRFQMDFHSPEKAEYKDVYIGFKNLPWNHLILIGNQKRPLGLDHLNSSRYNVFMERPLVVEAFNPDARRIGIAAYTYSPSELYTLRYGIFGLANTRNSGAYIGDSMQLSGNFRLSSSPWYDESSGGRRYFHWAIAGMLARPDGDAFDDDSNKNEARFKTRPELRSSSSWIDTGAIAGADWYQVAAAEAMLNLGSLQVVSEYQANWLQRDGSTPGTGPDVYFHGGYIFLHYMLTGEHIPYKRTHGTIDRVRPFRDFALVQRLRGRSTKNGGSNGWGAFGVGARISHMDLTDADILGGVETNTTLGVNWWWTAYSKLQLNFVYGRVSDRAPVNGFTEGDFFGIATRIQADF